MYLLKLSLRPWRLAPFSQLFSAIAVGFLLFLISFLFWMQQGLKPILTRLQGEQVIVAYIDHSTEKKDEAHIVDQIRMSAGAHPTTEVKLVDTSQFIDQLKTQYPDLGRELEDLGQEVDQIVPRYVSVAGILPASTLEKVRQIPGIESAESSKDRYASIVGAFKALRWIAGILMAGLCLALLTGLIHLSRMNAYLHRDALSLLRFWGAGNWILAAPGILSGLIVGFTGGGIAVGGWQTIGNALTLHVRALSVLLKAMPAAHSHVPVLLFFLGGAMGLIAGVLGSLSASHLPGDRGLGI